MLFQGAPGGLKVEDREHSGKSVPNYSESPTEAGVYVSDSLAQLINDYLRASVHQVVSPIPMQDKASNALLERCFPIPTFVNSVFHSSVEPFEKYVLSESERQYGELKAL
ncbi:hypothetical protein JX265_007475 [Neoarthrinium moseri]|uniref:Uncharacterized protein n=1 Tax=Neoarthrinium moseri TaxID=1658444 RepID=A0A9P9WJP5_9PEZI|nr:hypothetical protein JX266_000775 [Neoarthrinium moseri]KAI1866899.1 hypothetical protein JX265_007475 [Neoarthrinium moseri]